MMILRAFLLLLSILPSKSQVRVDVGGQTFLPISQFLPKPSFDHHGNCAIIVDQQAANNLRAGQVRPQSFSCAAPANLVRYIHDGNPHLKEDEVHFLVLLFQEFQVVEHKLQLLIQINLETSGIPSILASTSYTRVGRDAVRLPNRVTHDSRCVARLEIEPPSEILHHPSYDNKTSFSCREVPEFLLKLPDDDHTSRYMKIQYEIDSGEGLPNHENHFLPILSVMRKSLPNEPPEIRLGLPKSVYMTQYSLLIIHPKAIIVTDDSTPTDSILLRSIWHNTSQHDGFLVHIADPWKSITSFKYGDLLRRKIAFRGPMKMLSLPSSRELCLLAVDLQFAESSVVCFPIFIQPLSTSEPKIIEKKDMLVRRGFSRIISTHHVGLVNAEEVMLQVKGGPYNGSLEMDGKPVLTFNYTDIEAGKVVYIHNDDRNFFDKIILKVFNNVTSSRVQMDIRIIEPIDEAVPWIVNNEALNVSDVETPLTSHNIEALVSEMDEDNDELMFYLITFPQHGVLRKKHVPASKGLIVTSFTRKNLRSGMIYYQVTSKSLLPRTDYICLKVQHGLIRNLNASTEIKLSINIKSSSFFDEKFVIRKCSDLKLTATLSNKMTAIVFTAHDFCYSVDDGLVDDLQYVINSPPYFENGRNVEEAGAIVEVQYDLFGRLEAEKDRLIETFSQKMMNDARVAYKSPSCFKQGYCLSNKSVEFKFSVTCPRCLPLYDQVFTLHFPDQKKFTSSVMLLRLGETKLLNQLLKDALSNQSDGDDVVLLNNPEFGVLVRDGSVVKVNRGWTIKEFLSKNIWYQHSHQACSKDGVSFSTKHSIHRIDIVAQTESRSFTIEDLSVSLSSPTLLDPDFFSSKIPSSFNSTSRFEVIRQPEHGYIFVVGRNEDVRETFSLDELQSHLVNFKLFSDQHRHHRHHLKDSFLLLQNSESSLYPEKRRGDCQISLFNVSLSFSSEKPLLIVTKKALDLDLITRSAILNTQILTATSSKTIPDNQLTFVILQSPAWGRIVRSTTGHVTASEKPVTSFTKSDLKNSLVRYSLGNIYGRTNLGTLMDSFHVYVTDGVHNSSVGQVLVNISMPTYADNVVKRRNHRNVNKSNSKKTSRNHQQVRDEDGLGIINNNNVSTSLGFHSVISSIPNKDRGKNSLHLKVDNIHVPRKGQTLFTIRYERSPQKRRSMIESTLILDKPPSHGHLVLLRPQHDSIDQDLKEERFQNLSLTDISNEISMVYKHDGSESSHDNFVLSLANDNKSIKKSVSVKIGSKSKSAKLIKNRGLPMTDQTPATLNSSHLMVSEEFMSPDEIEYELIKQPTRGYLKILDQQLESSETELEVGSVFTQLDVNENRVLYVPVDGALPNDSFTFKVNDDPQLHAFNIFVKKHERILPPLRISLGDQSFHCLEENSFDGLEKVDHSCSFISIRKQPLFGVVGQQGHKFLAADLAKGRVCYYGHEHLKGDQFELAVFNECANTTVVSRKFVVDSGELHTPHLDVSVPLMVVHGDRVSLTPSNLQVSSDGVEASRIYFVVVDPPRHGRLLMDGQPVREFSQEDINSELISYESSRIDDSMMDYFLFFISIDKSPLARSASDGKASFFSILIQPASKIPPKLIVTSPHKNLAILDKKFVFRIDTTHLKALHSSFSSRELVYHIKSKTKHGHLEFYTTGRQVRRRFTQKDVDDNNLIFVLKNDSLATNDSFSFKLMDPNKNTIDNQRFSFEWSVVEFPMSQLKICKSSDVLVLPVLRRGLVSGTSSVMIRAKYLSDKEIPEHLKPSDGSITFRASSTKADWTLRLPSDGQKKTGIKIKLNLFNATNAVTGLKDKAVIHILDPKTGCSSRNFSSSQDSQFIIEDFYGDEDYEDSSEDEDDDDDYLEADWSFYKETMNVNQGAKREYQQMPIIPQPCNPSSKSLLFLDVSTSQLFKCNGKQWEKWGWTSNTSGHKPEEKKETLEEKSQKTCPLGWLLYGDNCFLSSKVKMTWTEAEEICRRDGGHLAFALSTDHLAWLSSLTDGSRFWIGLNNRRDISQWEFTGSALFSSIDLSRDIFYNWETHQPCSKCPRSRCVQVSEELLYSNKQCTKNRARFVCARPSRLLRSSRRAKNRRSRVGRHHRTK